MTDQTAAKSRSIDQGPVVALLKTLSSLRITVTLLSLAILLVFAGTTVQKELGIQDVQRKYFHSPFVWVDVRLFAPLWKWGYENLPGRLLMPGGFTIIGLLLVNLISALIVRFKYTWKRAGILLTHMGVILLITGEVVTSLVAREGHMVIDEGQTVNYVQDTRQAELAVIDPLQDNQEQVVSIPEARLSKQDVVSYPTLPFNIRVEQYFPNSAAMGPMQVKAMRLEKGQREIPGGDDRITFREIPRSSGVEASAQDVPSAMLALESAGQTIARFPVSAYLDDRTSLSIGGHTYQFHLRWKRTYKPYSLTLLRFSHDVYTGTADPASGKQGVPRNFASDVRLVDPTRHEDREVKIWMNHPLRYAGETFYQASFKPGDKTTVLQVVDNPGWLIPYVSCSMVALGMLVHFLIKLSEFLDRQGRPARVEAGPVPALRSPGARAPVGVRGYVVPALVTMGCLAFLGVAMMPPRDTTPYNDNAFGQLPVSYEGRVMPLDTLANVSLRIISGRSTLRTDAGQTVTASQWLSEVLARREEATKYKIFRIDHPDVQGLLSLDSSRTRFSFAEIMASSDKLRQQLSLVEMVSPKSRNLYQAKLAELAEHLSLFVRLWDGDTLFLAPPNGAQSDWHTVEAAMNDARTGAGKFNPGLAAYIATCQSRANDSPQNFNAAVDGYSQWLASAMPGIRFKTSFETLFNRADPFINSIYLYVLVFLLVCASWLIAPWQKTLQRTALWVLILTLAFHTLGLVSRIYIQGRPPVTNLYSSAIFIGWGAALCCILVEWIYRNGIGSLVATIIAFPALLIAHYLALSGDTMQMLQAVLDTNFWLATHVVVVTFGYTATLLAGMMAAVYLVGSIVVRADRRNDFQKTLTKMTYGTICFAMLCSFVGTVLGGIWADQSWGRFWGWDPKENGAVLVVIWNAIILHARFSGLVRPRGMMVLAVFGNIVTAWSWFGTNMMGVGLHSYGFMDSAVTWLGIFCASQLLIMSLGWVQSVTIPRAKLAAE